MFCVRIEDVIKHSESIATIKFERKIPSFPGQFLMVNVFGYEEIPLSLSSPNSVTVKAVGPTTEALVNSKPGELVGLRGPFGRPFTPSNRALIVAGGIGIAPLKFLHDYLIDRGAEVLVVFGARTAKDLIWADEFENAIFSTDDGSKGFRGNVVELVKGIDLSKFERIYCCGPKPMLRGLFELFKAKNVLDRAEFSLENYMRCGIGLCGSCVLENGARVCVEGPVFRGSELPKEFYNEKSGFNPNAN